MSPTGLRLPTGGVIDRERTLTFRFDGRVHHGHPGDTLASALLASGRRVVARSFKYHRPRGLYSIGSEEPNALVTVGRGNRRDPNVRTTMVEVHEGLEACAQNCWPSVDRDFMAVNGLLAPFFTAGFYYKTFMWPARFWRSVYEPLIRRAAGMGRAATGPDPDRYGHAEAHCDVLVIGAGPAGMAAAQAAADAGSDVMLVDEMAWLGGRLAFESEIVEGQPAQAWLSTQESGITAHPRIRVLRRTTAFGLYDGRTVGLLERVSDHLPSADDRLRQSSWTVRADHIVLATGALEQPATFPGNDRPGVMLAGAARGYVNRFAVAPGRCTLVLAVDADGYRTAVDLAAAGAGVAGVVDPRPTAPEAHAKGLAEHGIPIHSNARIRAVHGRREVTAAAISPLSGTDATAGGNSLIECDTIAVAGGWQPTVHLHSHLGHRPAFDPGRGIFLPPELPPGHSSVGACAGAVDTADCLAQGRRAGERAAGVTPVDEPAEPASHAREPAIPPAVTLAPEDRRRRDGKSFVDLQHDVTVADIELAHREGYRSIEHLKRYTTLGMATDQGKTSNIAGLGRMAELRGLSMGEVGTTTFRPPYTPVTIGAVVGPEAGLHYRPARVGSIEDWHRAAGAVMVQAGLWHRPRYYPQHPSETQQAASAREAAHVRQHAGIVDVSTLGKIELVGPDAPEVVDRLYCNGMKSLTPGRLRYGIMLREDGFVFDDGTVIRLDEHRYLLTTTTANAARVLSHIEFLLQVAWPELRAQAVSVTEQWAGFAIAGPASRSVLAALLPELALDDDSFPYLGVRRTTSGDAGLLVMRNSYSGERAYEVFVAADRGEAFWRRALEAGQPFDLRPYGTEAMGTLRIEKGHIAGPEIDGRTAPMDLGLERMTRKSKPYVGKVLHARPALQDPQRTRLVGLRALDATASLRAGALLGPKSSSGPDSVEGHVSSATWSPECGVMIGLGLLARGPERHGEIIEARDPLGGTSSHLQVTAPVFVDPEGERLHA